MAEKKTNSLWDPWRQLWRMQLYRLCWPLDGSYRLLYFYTRVCVECVIGVPRAIIKKEPERNSISIVLLDDLIGRLRCRTSMIALVSCCCRFVVSNFNQASKWARRHSLIFKVAAAGKLRAHHVTFFFILSNFSNRFSIWTLQGYPLRKCNKKEINE